MSYSVGEVAKMLELPASTLRYYEAQGLLPALSRSEGGQRRFKERDIEACRMIECLKASGLSIKEIKEFMDLVVEGDNTIEQRLALFENRREAVMAEIAQLEQTLSVLDFKRWYYTQAREAGTEDVVKQLEIDQLPEEHRAAKAILEGHKTSQN